MTKRPLLYFILTLLLAITACSREGCDSRSSQETKLLHEGFELVNNLSPHATQFVDSMLACAKDSQSYYEYYLLKGRLFMLGSTPDSALPYYRDVIRYVSSQPSTARNNGILAVAYNSEAAYNHLLRQKIDTTITLYQKAMELAANSDLIEFLPEITANLGDAYIMNNDLPKGAFYYRRALFLVDSLQLPESKEITLYMGLGQIYTTLHDYDTALKYYRLTDQLKDDMSPGMKDYFLNNYGNCYYFMGDYPQARDMFIRLKQHIEQYGGDNTFDMFLCKINLADVYLNLGQTDSATFYVDQAEPYFREQKVAEGTNYANVIRIGIALKENNLDKAGQLIDQLGFNPKMEYNLLSVHSRYLGEFYERTSQYKKAYENLKQFIIVRDSTEHNRQHMRAAEIMMRLQQDTLELHHQLAIEEHRVYVNRSRFVLLAMLALIVILALCFHAYVSYAHKRRLQDSINVMQLKLSNARNRISPHFIFNVLNNSMNGNATSTVSLRKLSSLIRQNLNLTDRAYVSLKEEIDFVRQYLEVESPMLMPDFKFTIDVPDEYILEKITVPSMIIQIMAENAVVHALKGKEGPKRLTIKASHDEQETIISVIDNGPGFDIRHREGRATKNGLKIITHTIQIINEHNKQACHMHFTINNIESDKGILGCEATITIPNHINYL